MLRAKDFRQRAWQSLNGRWGIMALITLLYSIILGACSGLSIIGIGTIAMLLLEGPLMLGYVMVTMGIIRGKEPRIENLFDGFKDFVNAFLLSLINGIFIFLWSLLFIIPGIIKGYSYAMSYYILADNPGMAANDARKKSMELMRGNKWRLFCLHFSFIGWGLLTLLTFGILSFWVMPYIQTAEAAFYQSLAGDPIMPEGVNEGITPDVQPNIQDPFEELRTERRNVSEFMPDASFNDNDASEKPTEQTESTQTDQSPDDVLKGFAQDSKKEE